MLQCQGSLVRTPRSAQLLISVVVQVQAEPLAQHQVVRVVVSLEAEQLKLQVPERASSLQAVLVHSLGPFMPVVVAVVPAASVAARQR